MVLLGVITTAILYATAIHLLLKLYMHGFIHHHLSCDACYWPHALGNGADCWEK